MEHLSKIFNSSARVKIMRLFLSHDSTAFDVADVSKRSKVSLVNVRKELKILFNTGFLKKKTFTKEVIVKTKKKKPTPLSKSTKGKNKTKVVVKKVAKTEPITKKKRVSGWIINPNFPLTEALHTLLIDSELVKTKELPKRLNPGGKIKMLVLSGIFMKDTERGTDMVIVGEKLDMKKLYRTLQNIEAEVGRELRYSVFTPEEFKYRMEMYDQHLLDIFEYPHEKVIDKLGLLSQVDFNN